MEERIRIILCGVDTGGGGGIARMDTFFHRFLNRETFDPVFVLPTHARPGETPYDPSIEYVYTGGEGRFGKLVEIFRDADIVQFSGGFDPLICEAARAAGVPVLVEVMHLVEPGQLFGYIDVTVCVSKAVQKAQPNPAKTAVVLNGIDTDQFSFREGPKEGAGMVFIEASRREKPKFFHLDELASDLQSISGDIEIWMAGRGQTGRSTEGVKYLGMRDDIAELYGKADVMALLSKMEPFGLVAVEAMACGCLPIVSDNGGLAEIVTHGVDGWLVPGHDRAAVLRTMKEAVETRNTPKWEKMRRAARKTAVQKFSGRECVRQYERIYLDLVERKGRRAESGPAEGAAPTPEADVGEATYQYSQRNWDGVRAAAARMAAHPAPLKSARLAEVLTMLAMHAMANGQGDIADLFYGKLYRSGYAEAEWLAHWMRLGPAGPEADEALSQLIESEPGAPEWVMLRAERLLNEGRLEDALDALERGAQAAPDATEIVQTRDLLREKLGKRE